MPQESYVKIDVDRVIGSRDPMIFGHFIEHFHRQIYGGLFDPDSPLSDSRGFRTDVIEALKRIRVPIIRWPGGCFASAYHWKDGVGKRTPVFDKAWRVEEPNTFGTDEFVQFCAAVGAEPYICTNAGTGTPEEMSDWVEYCNCDTGPWAAMRRQNGHAEPHNVKYWSIGNENYGSWEMGGKSTEEWGRYVAESAKMMKRPDSSIELSAASTPHLDWNLNLLKEAGQYLDWISIHGYWVRGKATYEACIARSGDPDETISHVEHILGAVGLLDKIRISYDEWNLRGWYHPSAISTDPNVAERDLNDDNSTYTMADAVFAGRFLNACLRHCRTVGMANFSPVVNTRGAVFTHPSGLVLRSAYHVFDLYVNHTSAQVLDALVESPSYTLELDKGGSVDVPYLDAAVTRNNDTNAVNLIVVSTHKEHGVDCEIDLPGVQLEETAALATVGADSADSYNDVDHPNDVRLTVGQVDVPSSRFVVTLPAHSVSVLTLQPIRR